MKTLVIIDDELFFRKSLYNYLNKLDSYEIIGEANNGQAGFELIKESNPDIALVDVSMPVMNGLEMIRLLSDLCSTKFILLTGFSDFEYAKQAITLGVKDYLLKPLNNDELIQCLTNISDEIDKEKKQTQMISDYYHYKSLYTKQMRLNFFHQVITDNYQPDEFDVNKKQLGLNHSTEFLVVLLQIKEIDSSFWEESQDYSIIHFAMENITMEIIQSIYPESIYIDYSNYQQFIILGNNCLPFFKDQYEPLMFRIIELLNETVHISINIFSGSPYYNASGIQKSYEECISVLHNQCNTSCTSYLRYDMNIPGMPFTFSYDFYEHTLSLLRKRDKDKLAAYITQCFTDMQSHTLHIRQIWNIVSAFLTILNIFLTECNQGKEHIYLQEALVEYPKCENILELKTLIINTYFSELDKINSALVSERSSLFMKIQDYIINNYNSPSLRLDTIAKNFYMSPQYLSSVFSQESDMTLTTYINTLRMKKAKELLLQESPSIQNTASLCGFTDSGYFSKCFKKYYGISPKNFLLLINKEKL